MAITKLDDQSVTHLRNDIETALKLIAGKYNLCIKTGGVRYTPTEGKFKITVNTIDTDGTIETAARTKFVRLAASYNLDPDWLDKEFTHEGDTYKIVGLNPRAKRYPVEAVNVYNKKQYKFPTRIVIRAMR